MTELQPMKYAQLRGRLLGKPLAVLPEHAQAIVQVLGPRLGIRSFEGAEITKTALEVEEADQAMMMHPDRGYARGERQPYELNQGVAFIPIEGTIVQKYSGWNALCGNTSTEALVHVMAAAFDDPGVRAIYLDIDSPGGEVAGTFDAVDQLMALKRAAGKPVHAHANELAASAAYAIASVADHLSTPRTGHVGSVGVIWLHAEQSAMLDALGINVTVIRRGDRKAEANSVEPLTPEAAAWMQQSVDETFELFVSSVVANRGALTRDTVIDTQSALLTSAEAERHGFIDAVMSEQQAIAHVLARAAQP